MTSVVAHMSAACAVALCPVALSRIAGIHARKRLPWTAFGPCEAARCVHACLQQPRVPAVQGGRAGCGAHHYPCPQEQAFFGEEAQKHETQR
jgi:hypothetical protein